jgi:hypothetical protein
MKCIYLRAGLECDRVVVGLTAASGLSDSSHGASSSLLMRVGADSGWDEFDKHVYVRKGRCKCEARNGGGQGFEYLKMK